ncbi:MAG: diguanylate cyclase [Verrucomicrobia bacterium]|nr:diguanylate cyclase [Verrucomicrobiota bacterium]MBU1736468.1 diguanylate cyclase [Verrucomicrobiota bacterium]MBU1857235.1 diguanylate cyclase [Verrucomicrobiota bacterium]
MPDQRKEITEYLITIIQELASTLTAEEALHVIIEQMKVFFPHQSLAVLLLDENTGTLYIKTSRQISYSFVKQFKRNISGEIVPRVLLKHEQVFINDLQSDDPEYACLKLEHDFKHLCLAPIIQNQRAIGYLHCERTEGLPFTEEDARLMLIIAYLIGQQIQKFELLFLTRNLSLIDEASKALKYQAFVDQFSREMIRAKMHHTSLVLIFLNLDDYVVHVATSGIDAGHALLEEVHHLIKECIRPIDIVGRFSANEFVVCLGGMKPAEAEPTLEHIRKEIQQRATRSSGHPVNVSGVAMTFERPEDFDLPLEKILAALGSGLITVRAKGKHQSASIPPPRK